jgi:predicted RNase H-like nuclease (RuvC/YqgF family)
MSDDVLKSIVAALASIIGAWFLYKGAQKTTAAARAGSEQAAAVDDRADVMQAWKDLNAPLQAEVTRLHARQTELEQQQIAERQAAAAEARRMQAQITTLTERVDFLQVQLQHWKRLARVMARWATTLRDQVLTLGGTVPATPEELLLIQSLDDDDF